MKEKKKLAAKAPIIAAILILAGAVTVLGQVIVTHYHPVDWTVLEPSAEFELYVDDVLTPTATTLTFGDMLIGTSDTKSLRVVNIGNVPIKMSMSVIGLPGLHTLVWDADGTVVGVDAEITGDLTLTVLTGAATGAKSCDIEIKATEES